MTNYVWSARDQSGNTVIKEVKAKTAEDSKYILLAQGYRDLELKEDDFIAAVQAGFSDQPKTFLGEDVKISVEQRVQFQDKRPDGYLTFVLKSMWQTKWVYILIIILAVDGVYHHNKLMLGLLGVAMVAWTAFFICLATPLVLYTKIIQAMDWHRWAEVMSLLARLKVTARFSFGTVPQTELIRIRCQTLAGMGRLDEALTEYKDCEGRPGCPSWLYKAFVGSLYGIAKRYDEAIKYNQMSIAENPTSVAYLDLANRYARYKRDPLKAREAMAEADKLPIAEVAKTFRIRCFGIIAYLEGDWGAAKRDLEMAIAMLEKAKGRPYRDGHLSVSRAYLCCVLARQSDLAAAKNCFASAKAYLIATREDELLAECRRLAGVE